VTCAQVYRSLLRRGTRCNKVRMIPTLVLNCLLTMPTPPHPPHASLARLLTFATTLGGLAAAPQAMAQPGTTHTSQPSTSASVPTLESVTVIGSLTSSPA